MAACISFTCCSFNMQIYQYLPLLVSVHWVSLTLFFTSYLRCLHQDPIKSTLEPLYTYTNREKLNETLEGVITEDVAKHRVNNHTNSRKCNAHCQILTHILQEKATRDKKRFEQVLFDRLIYLMAFNFRTLLQKPCIQISSRISI